MNKYLGRTSYDWVAMSIVVILASVIISLVSSCEVHAQSAVPEVVLQTIAMEGASETIEGQSLIASTLLNRALIRGTTPEIEALRRKQYSCWNMDSKTIKWRQTWLSRHYTQKVRLRALNAYKKAMLDINSTNPKGLTKNYKGVTMYHTKNCKPKWDFSKLERLGQIGAHIFYRERPVKN